MKRNVFFLLLFLLPIALNGCSKEEMEKMVSDAKDSMSDIKGSTDDAVAKVKNAARSAGDLTGATDFTGSATLQLSSPQKFAASYLRLIPVPETEGQGGAVLQIKGSRDGEAERFPDFLVQGRTNLQSLSELDGKTVPCVMFAQTNDEGTVWSNFDAQPILISVSKTEKGYTAKFESGTLINSETDSNIQSSGTFECVEY